MEEGQKIDALEKTKLTRDIQRSNGTRGVAGREGVFGW
jgi:hypothetical protein